MTYNPALTGLRGAAILPVIGFHCLVPGFSGGFYGVDVFFVLSGFLITGLLLAERDAAGGIDLFRFYLNRLLRLTPPLFVFLGAVLALGLTEPTKVLLAGLYLTDVVAPFSDHPYGAVVHTWSLSVEEHFYLVWPVILILLLRARDPLRWAVVLFVLATAWRLATIPLLPGEMTYFRLDVRLSGLLLGSAIAIAGTRMAIGPLTQRLSIYVLVLALVSQQIYTTKSLVAMTAVELASAGLLLTALQTGTPVYRFLSSPWLVKIGLWSYGLYLWHYPVSLWLRAGNPWPVTIAATLVLSLVLASASYYLIEAPMHRLRKRWLARRDSSPVAAEA